MATHLFSGYIFDNQDSRGGASSPLAYCLRGHANSLSECRNTAHDLDSTARKAKGWSQQTLGGKTGVSRAAIAQWETGATVPKPRRIAGIAEALGISILDLLTAAANSPPPPTPSPAVIRPDARPLEHSLPVYASAAGGEGRMILSYEPVEWTRPPEPLASVQGGFGMYVIGDSMAPAYASGDMILVHPHKPVRPGDDVLVVKNSSGGWHEALVKRLAALDAKTITLSQFNPPEKFKVSRSELHGLYLIVGCYRTR